MLCGLNLIRVYANLSLLQTAVLLIKSFYHRKHDLSETTGIERLWHLSKAAKSRLKDLNRLSTSGGMHWNEREKRFFLTIIWIFCRPVLFVRPMAMVAGLCHFVFSPFRSKRTPREKTKKMPCEKTKRRKNAMRKDETHHAKRWNFSAKRPKSAMRKDAIWNFNFVVFLRGVFFSSFRFFCLASLTRLFAWRYFVFSSGVFSRQNNARGKDAMRKDEITPCEKTK